MKKIDMSERAIETRLLKADQLHALSVELLKVGRAHYEKLKSEGKANDRDLERFRKFLVS